MKKIVSVMIAGFGMAFFFAPTLQARDKNIATNEQGNAITIPRQRRDAERFIYDQISKTEWDEGKLKGEFDALNLAIRDNDLGEFYHNDLEDIRYTKNEIKTILAGADKAAEHLKQLPPTPDQIKAIAALNNFEKNEKTFEKDEDVMTQKVQQKYSNEIREAFAAAVIIILENAIFFGGVLPAERKKRTHNPGYPFAS